MTRCLTILAAVAAAAAAFLAWVSYQTAKADHR